MAKAEKCPYCNSKDIKRSMTGYIEEGVGMAIGGGISFLAKSIGIDYHICTKGVRDFIPTEYICNRCNKTFTVTSINGDIEICNEDAPDNVKKKQIKESNIYSCTIISVDMSSWWKKYNTQRVLESYCGLSSEQVHEMITHLPQRVSFESKDKLEEFKMSLTNYDADII